MLRASSLSRILIVDDSLSVVKQLSAILAEEVPGAEIYAAPDVASAERLFGEHQPDLVFLDMMLSGGSGRDFMRAFDRATHESLVIVTTSLPPDHPHVVDAVAMGAFALLRKPLRRAAVKSIVDTVLSESAGVT